MDISYGSDKNGLLCGYRFENGAPGQPIDLAEATAWLRNGEAKAAGDFVWLHFNLSDAAAEACIRKQLDVVPEFFEALHEGSRSTRIEDAHDTLIAVVNDVAYEFAFDPAEIASLWLNVGPHMAISARSHPLRSIDRMRAAVKSGKPLPSSVAFLNTLLQEQGDVLVRIVRDATVQVDVIEDKFLVGRLQNRRADLGKLRRVLVRLQRLLAPEPGALFRLLRLPPPWISEHDLEELRQATEEFSLTIRDMSELKERIKLLQEEIAAQVSEQTNRSVFTLTMVTVLALPINIVAGLLGMNVGGIPLAEYPHGFMAIVSMVAVFTALAAWYLYRRKD
ncbi:zinc transporter [Rhodoferax ferrireducens]|uniref:Zinc transporter n=1 Tax=Rhodoferax ferrireducens TaxID=192843 RepID=A0ABU2CBW3_9BURK|nr:transporter [Rhodoferax ferrireducens]MDR7378810.1 zinc transporter [Rhodoferax ferrireducens]